MKSSSALLVLGAATCLVSVQAHTMLVCSATSCKTPGRVTVFLGTYHDDPRREGAGETPGGISITSMAGKSYDFKFASTCETLKTPTPTGSDNFETLEKSFRAEVGPYSSNSAPRACSGQLDEGKPIIDEESIISCYNGDLMENGQVRTTPLGVTMAAEWITSEKTFCAFRNSPLHGFYYMTMDNVVPGDYTISGWTTDYILAHQPGSGVCSVVGWAGSEQAAKEAGETYAFSLSVATQQCAANLRCQIPSQWEIAGLDEKTTEICDKTNGALPGYMCNAKCLPGFTQVGSMVCGDDGQWTGFSCHSNEEQTTKPCSIADLSNTVANAGSLQYDAEKGCGYMSTHNAECEVSCEVGVKIGGALVCNNGVWDNTRSTECREIEDVVLAPLPSVSASQQEDGSIKVTWDTATECSTGPYCSAAFKYDFVVTNKDGEEATLGCMDYNNGIAPADGITCVLPQGAEFTGGAYTIRVRAQNDKGWSQPSADATIFVTKVLTAGEECFVASDDRNAIGPHMRDEIDVFGKDWVKFYSLDGPAVGLTVAQPTRVETLSASSCCSQCAKTPGCDYWTYVKNSTACYLKHQDDKTVYTDQWDPSRVSGAASPVVHNAQAHAEQSWHPEIGWNPNLRGERRRLAAPAPAPITIEAPKSWHLSEQNDDTKYCAQELSQANWNCNIPVTNDIVADGNTCFDFCQGYEFCAFDTSKVNGYRCCQRSNICDDVKDSEDQRKYRIFSATNWPTKYYYGIDWMGDDWVKFSNYRVEATNPQSCEQACLDDAACCYWTWSPLDEENGCYLKSDVPMDSKANGFGRPVYSFAVVSGVPEGRCGLKENGGVSGDIPVVYPTNIFRRHFARLVPSLDVYPESRPPLYMVGSGITKEYIEALDVNEDKTICNKRQIETPCFTQEEIDLALDRHDLEKEAFCKLSSDDVAQYKAAPFGGRDIQC